MTLENLIKWAAENGPVAVIAIALLYIVFKQMQQQNLNADERVAATKESAKALQQNALAQQQTTGVFKDMERTVSDLRQSIETLETSVRNQTTAQVHTGNVVREKLVSVEKDIQIIREQMSK